MPLGYTFTKLNQVLRGWINYFRIGSMKGLLRYDFGQWMRHKVRVVILNQWRKPKTIYKNLMKLNKKCKCGLKDEAVYMAANASHGWYRKDCMEYIQPPAEPESAFLAQ